jgi:hypothetical protein
MLWGQADQEGFLEQVDPLRALEVAALCGGVLVADGDVELAAEKAWFEGVRCDLAEPDSKVAMSQAEPGDRGRHEAREGGRKHAETHFVAALLGQIGDLGVGQLQAPRDVVCVFEQDFTGVRQAQSAASAVEQADADLGLQQGDLVRHRRL